jgi:hypothetical protein
MPLQITDFLEQPLSALVTAIRMYKGTRLGDFTLKQLADPNPPFNGIYVFMDAEDPAKCNYVGKCSSRSFIGRLSAHADPRKDFDKNNFVQAMMRKPTSLSFTEALGVALGSPTVLISIGEDLWPGFTGKLRAAGIQNLEGALQVHMHSRFNSPRRKYQQVVGRELVRTLVAA